MNDEFDLIELRIIVAKILTTKVLVYRQNFYVSGIYFERNVNKICKEIVFDTIEFLFELRI